jgi:hypothetical protein
VNAVRMAIIAATGNCQKTGEPCARDLCTIAAIHGHDRHRRAALGKQNGIPHYFLDAERSIPVLCEEATLLVDIGGHGD